MTEPRPARAFTSELTDANNRRFNRGDRATEDGDQGRTAPVSGESPRLEQQVRELKQEIAELQARRDRLLQDQAQGLSAAVTRLVEEGVVELEQRRRELQASIEQLERRQERIRAEMRKSFAGVSQDLAVRLQGFKDYLVGSLQDLATTAEQLELEAKEPLGGQRPAEPSMGQAMPPAVPLQPPTLGRAEPRRGRSRPQALQIAPDQLQPPQPQPPQPQPPATSRPSSLGIDAAHIRQRLEQYQATPNYYGKPWQLRRTFEPVHAGRASQWFFDLGGRGAIKTMGSRLQNVLIASAIISILRDSHGDRLRALILSDSPERLGEWRRGLQDCLGISRTDFGAQRGIVLFEAPETVAQRAERLIEQGQVPLILIDEGEDKVSLSLLQFPLWLAFAPDPVDPLGL